MEPCHVCWWELELKDGIDLTGALEGHLKNQPPTVYNKQKTHLRPIEHDPRKVDILAHSRHEGKPRSHAIMKVWPRQIARRSIPSAYVEFKVKTAGWGAATRYV